MHRIERVDSTDSMGANINVLVALGMRFGAHYREKLLQDAFIPASIRLEKYLQLKKLACQLKARAELTPLKALGNYDRNALHIDQDSLDTSERQLFNALRIDLGGEINIFSRPHHQKIAHVPQLLDHQLLRDHHCFFKAGTAIALMFD